MMVALITVNEVLDVLIFEKKEFSKKFVLSNPIWRLKVIAMPTALIF